jgi:histidine triad (HIT) family protein
MDDCIFCKIAKGEAPAYKIYEDKNFLAFLSLFPETSGQTLVIPKKHYRWVWDVDNIGEYFEICQKVAKHFQKVTKNDAVYAIILGEEIPHAHIRIYPTEEMSLFNGIFELMQKLSKGKLMEAEALKLLDKFKLQ